MKIDFNLSVFVLGMAFTFGILAITNLLYAMEEAIPILKVWQLSDATAQIIFFVICWIIFTISKRKES
ncbi:hypothetical protein [Shewanella sp.]|jgi:hypothetical protein|uniref:hypothetical protein n=1 Tax=Shewanella sp. TaxID=50422 RepID=UPI003565FB41